ncbi:hypothetical protein HMPREF3172_03610 [Brevibacterium sp. HMSC08F02]|nr:hypothetical protein HMPREF3172_03610 [Brevibacterium sp. HMSC08F02]
MHPYISLRRLVLDFDVVPQPVTNLGYTILDPQMFRTFDPTTAVWIIAVPALPRLVVISQKALFLFACTCDQD